MGWKINRKEIIQTRGNPARGAPVGSVGGSGGGGFGQQQPSNNNHGDEFSMDDYNDYAKLESGFENDPGNWIDEWRRGDMKDLNKKKVLKNSSIYIYNSITTTITTAAAATSATNSIG